MEFIETLLVKNGKIQNIKYHLKRMEKTAKYFKFQVPSSEFKDLNEKLKVKSEKLRCRIIYNQFGIQNIEYFPIKEREFTKFKIVEIDFNYSFKYKNRNSFSTLHYQFSIYDEFILIKNNLITDTTISNLAFFTGSEWLTPKYPLLQGTKRAELIDKGILKEENIHKYDLPYFKKIAMLNAIIGFKEIEDYDIIM